MKYIHSLCIGTDESSYHDSRTRWADFSENNSNESLTRIYSLEYTAAESKCSKSASTERATDDEWYDSHDIWNRNDDNSTAAAGDDNNNSKPDQHTAWPSAASIGNDIIAFAFVTMGVFNMVRLSFLISTFITLARL